MTQIRLYCADCSATTVVKNDDPDTDWQIRSLTLNAGTCPECRAGVETMAEPSADDDSQPSLTAFVFDGGGI